MPGPSYECVALVAMSADDWSLNDLTEARAVSSRNRLVWSRGGTHRLVGNEECIREFLKGSVEGSVGVDE